MESVRVLAVGNVPELDGDSFVVDRVPTAAAAQDILTESAVDCIVSTDDLPDGDGLSFLQRVRKIEPGTSLPFILWVEDGDEQIAARALNLGTTSYVRADDGVEYLRECIRSDVSTARRERDGERFGAIVSALDDPVYVLDETGAFVYVNDAFVEQFGYDRAAIVGEHPDLIKDETGVAEAEAQLGRLLSDDGPEDVTFEVEIETADGDVLVCEDHMGVLPYEGEEFRGSIGVLRDVTARKQRERELRRYEAFVENTTDAITILDPDGTITYASPAAATVYGHDPESLVGMEAYDIIHPDDVERIGDTIAELLETPGETTVEEFRVERADGSVSWIESTAVSGHDGAAIEGLLAVSRSITERKEYEQRLEEQRDNLEVLNEILRHDVRNDLQMVFSYAGLLRDEVGADGTAYIEKIEERAQSAVDLTETARDLAAAMQQTETPLAPVELRRTLRSEVDGLQSAYDSATVALDGDVPAVTVEADEMLGSVFNNLLQNAIQHNDSDEPVVEVEAERSNGTVTVTIADNGPGIPEDAKKTIFGKGEKGLESGGTGMGLYLVQTLIDRYGGDVSVTDNEPRGAVFIVDLPIAG